ncbi:ankyrin repeat domain-containing protein, partial [archaeon]
LLDTGANIEAATIDGWTPLHLACQEGHEACVRVMLDARAHVSAGFEFDVSRPQAFGAWFLTVGFLPDPAPHLNV